MAVPLLFLGAVARLATLDDAEASTDLLSHLDNWAWAVGILLILADLLLPIPQASVITALGAIYGIALGTLIGTVGLIFNGAAGYLLMSTPVRRVIERALKGRSAEAIAALSDRAGPWGIALSGSLLATAGWRGGAAGLRQHRQAAVGAAGAGALATTIASCVAARSRGSARPAPPVGPRARSS